MDLKGQKIVIMGGTSGIGLSLAKMAASSGASVIITGRDEAKLKQAVSELPDTVKGEAVDAASAGAINGFFSKLGIFDHLVLSLSGKSGGGPFAVLKAEQLRQGFESKFFAYFNAIQGCLKTIRPGGSITLVTASSARTSFPGTSGLAAINGALEAMIPTLALELKPVRINAVSPGIIDTPWWSTWPEEQKKAVFSKIASDTPAGRVGKPEDIAHAIMFLLENTFTTGIVLECDGGIRLK
jgi:NAD(P)-dependent dehydrogenase (short-subunit alcohol dehydrogenase family)